jgi:hypothetical protein
MMETRNQHIAHSELRLEKSYAGITLVDDPNYGRRPSGIVMAIWDRRSAPRKDKLLEMAAHCCVIIKEYLNPKMLKTGLEIREKYLKLPKEQFDALPDYFGEINPTEMLDEHIWREPTNADKLK